MNKITDSHWPILFLSLMFFLGAHAGEPISVKGCKLEIVKEEIKDYCIVVSNQTKQPVQIKTNLARIAREKLFLFPVIGRVQFQTSSGKVMRTEYSDQDGWISPALFSSIHPSLTREQRNRLSRINLEPDELMKFDFSVTQVLPLVRSDPVFRNEENIQFRIKIPILIRVNNDQIVEKNIISPWFPIDKQ